MRESKRADPDRDLDGPEAIAVMVRRFYADVAQDGMVNDRRGPSRRALLGSAGLS